MPAIGAAADHADAADHEVDADYDDADNAAAVLTVSGPSGARWS